MIWILVALLRLVVPLLILRRPLLGAVVAILLDAADWELLPLSTSQDFLRYQVFDKTLDFYSMGLAAYVLLASRSLALRLVSLGLFIVRSVGLLLFLLTGLRHFLFFFPNLFESLFWFALLYKGLTGREYNPSLKIWAFTFLFVGLPKVLQEYVFHIAQVMPWQIYTKYMQPLFDNVNLSILLWISLYLYFPLYFLITRTRVKTLASKLSQTPYIKLIVSLTF